MRETRPEWEMAELDEEDIKEIRALEKRLGDICLVAVKKGGALYVLEAKMAPNVWQPVDRVYAGIENLKAYYSDEETAKLSKGALKSFLAAGKKEGFPKRPIRIRKIIEDRE